MAIDSTQDAAAIRLRINGDDHAGDWPERLSLLVLLRERLGLTGTRFGCGTGQCGACMVLVDGRPMTACDTPLWSIAGKSVTTIEGLGSPQRPHPVQAALLALQAGQCGYCLAGIAISAAALVDHEPRCDRRRIAEALDRHLCRCGAHQRILRAVEQAGAGSVAATEDPR